MKKYCKNCNIEYNALKAQTYFCPPCKKERITCFCGAKKGMWSVRCANCACKYKKGKTYKEIFGTDNPGCGYQKGDKNIARRKDIREKISKNVKASYTKELRKQRGKFLRDYNMKRGFMNSRKKWPNSKGELFRSSLEAEFSDLLIENGYAYKYEVPIKMINGRYKIVDFQVEDILIEISGYAYEKWKKDFNEKMSLLRKTVNNLILVITYEKKIEDMFWGVADTNLFITTIEDKKKLVKSIKWLIDLSNKIKKYDDSN